MDLIAQFTHTHTHQRPILTSFFPLNNTQPQGMSRAGTTRVAVTHPDPPHPCVSVPPAPLPSQRHCRGSSASLTGSPDHPPGNSWPCLPALFPLPWSLVLHSEPLCSGGSVREPLFSLHTQCPSDLCQASTRRLGNCPPAPCASPRGCLKGLPHLPLPRPQVSQLPGLLRLPSGPPPEAPRLHAATSSAWATVPCPARNPDPSEVTAHHPFPPTSGSHPSALSPRLACSGHLTQTNVHTCPWGSGFPHSV